MTKKYSKKATEVPSRAAVARVLEKIRVGIVRPGKLAGFEKCITAGEFAKKYLKTTPGCYSHYVNGFVCVPLDVVYQLYLRGYMNVLGMIKDEEARKK